MNLGTARLMYPNIGECGTEKIERRTSSQAESEMNGRGVRWSGNDGCLRRIGKDRANSLISHSLIGPSFAEGLQDHHAADGKDSDGQQGHHLRASGLEAQAIGEKGEQRKPRPQDVQPDRRLHGDVVLAIEEAQLQKHGDQSNRGHDHYGDRAKERAAVGEQHYEREHQAKNAGGDDRPATVLSCGFDQVATSVTVYCIHS